MFSRWMPQYEQPHAETSSGAYAILALLGLALLWYLVTHLRAAAVLAAGGLLLALAHHRSNRKRMHEARARGGEDIGTFARALDRRAPTFDPWIIRAVWDALAPWAQLPNGSRFPLRPTDVIEELGCVDEDLDDVVVQAASRARRQLDQANSESYADRIVTVADLVNFLARQPVAPAA